MIHHLVCFRFKPGTTAAAIERAGVALRGMKGPIPEVREVYWGPNLAPSAAEYPWVLTVVVDDMAAVQQYLAHPVHQQVVAEHLAPVRDGRLAIDVEL
jgi:hypothetical protein